MAAVDGYEFHVVGTEATLTSVPFSVEAIRGAVAAAARCGATSLDVTVGPDYPGGDAAMDVLAAMSAAPVGVSDILATNPSSARPEALEKRTDVDVVEVQTREQVAEFERTSARAWGHPSPSDEAIEASCRKLEPGSFLAISRGAPAGMGGFTLVGPVARFWGAAVVPYQRGRGVYRALVAARLARAAERGATLALVHAEPTSSPILQWLGFEKFGERCTFRVVVGTE